MCVCVCHCFWDRPKFIWSTFSIYTNHKLCICICIAAIWGNIIFLNKVCCFLIRTEKDWHWKRATLTLVCRCSSSRHSDQYKLAVAYSQPVKGNKERHLADMLFSLSVMILALRLRSPDQDNCYFSVTCIVHLVSTGGRRRPGCRWPMMPGLVIGKFIHEFLRGRGRKIFQEHDIEVVEVIKKCFGRIRHGSCYVKCACIKESLGSEDNIFSRMSLSVSSTACRLHSSVHYYHYTMIQVHSGEPSLFSGYFCIFACQWKYTV